MAESTILKTFKYRIRETAKFTKAAALALDSSRFTYNSALEQRILRYRQGKPIGFFEQCRELTEARKLSFVGRVPRKIQLDALRRLDLAFEAFFRRVKQGKFPGFPRFKDAKRYSTFSQEIDHRHVCLLSGDVLRVPGIGHVRVRLSRPIEGVVRRLRITRRSDGWYALLVCRISRPEPLPKTGESIGVDVGLANFAALSNGEMIDNPRYLRRATKALKRSRKALCRKVIKSSNRAKARHRLALKHLKIQNARMDFHHKIAVNLVRRFDSIKVEDLKIPNMLKNHSLAGSILDAAWGQFLTITQFKAENAGRVFEKVESRYTSQMCSSCGHGQKMPLRVRQFVCEKCNHTLDRDHNAAINIRESVPKFTPAESHRGSWKQERAALERPKDSTWLLAPDTKNAVLGVVKINSRRFN